MLLIFHEGWGRQDFRGKHCYKWECSERSGIVDQAVMVGNPTEADRRWFRRETVLCWTSRLKLTDKDIQRHFCVTTE